MEKIGIIGVGVLGEVIEDYYKKNHHVFCYDNHKNIGSVREINRADIIFICVPTPRGTDNSCDISIVDEVIGYIRDEKIVVIKSTVIPGTTDAPPPHDLRRTGSRLLREFAGSSAPARFAHFVRKTQK